MCALAAFCASVPFLLPNLDLLHRVLLPGIGDPAPLVAVSSALTPLRISSLAAMFTALGMLFICLLKTAYGHLTMHFVVAGTVSYLVGVVLLSVVAPFVELPTIAMQAGMALLGFGFAVLLMAWMLQVDMTGFGMMARTLVILFVVVCAIDAVLIVLPVEAEGALRVILAIIGCVGCIRGFRRQEYTGVTVPGSNWWDIFGRLDVSLIDDADDFTSPATRVIFFIVTPAVILLLLVLDMDMHHSVLGDEFPIEIVGGLIACALAVPLLIIKTDRRTLQMAYRIYLPIVGAAVFIIANFVDESMHGLVIDVGVFAFCSLYGMLMAALLLTMAGRMPSLRLPSACLMVLAICVMATVSYMRVNAGSLMGLRLTMLMVLLVAAIALLAAAPNAHIWSIAFADPGQLAAAVESGDGPTLEDRCKAVARTYGLTPREGEILQYLGRGHGSAYIANTLVVAESTVRSHVKSIYRKMDVSSREELLECIDRIELP